MGPFGETVQFNGPDKASEANKTSIDAAGRRIRGLTHDPWFYVTTLLALLIVALTFFIIMTVRSTNEQLRTYRREIQSQRLQSTLGSALIDADRGEFEKSRQAAGDFYTALEIEFASDDPLLTPRQREAMLTPLARKQVVMQMLANKDPRSVKELSDAYDSCSRTLKSFQPLIDEAR